MPLCQVCGRANADDARFCFSCGTGLSQGPPVKVEVKSPLTGYTAPPPPVPSVYAPRQSQRAGSCYYHPELPSSVVCSRCGRSICAGCARQYGMLSFCTECYWGLAPKIGYGAGQYQMGYQQPEQGRSPFSLF